jgi:hypothetical protein
LDNSALLPFPVGILNKHTHTKKKNQNKNNSKIAPESSELCLFYHSHSRIISQRQFL